MSIQKNAYVDVNPVIVTSKNRIILAKRDRDIVGGGKWHLPGGRVLSNETFEETLERVAFDKTRLQIKLLYPSLKESLVGIYDNPERDPREHVIGIAFLCRIVAGEPKPGRRVDQVKRFYQGAIKKIRVAFDHKKIIFDAFESLKEG